MQTPVLLFFVLGLVFGSFGNVVILRLPLKKSLGGRSRCDHCRKKLGIIDLIPVLSFAFLGGRCRHCGKALSLQYPLVELGSGILFALAAVVYPAHLHIAIITALLLWMLLLTAVFDGTHQQIPDLFTGFIAACALILSVFSQNFLSAFFGTMIAFFWFGGQWVLSRKRAVGTGDIFLGMALGWWLGLIGTITMLLLAYMTGAIVLIILLLAGVVKFRKERISFGPFLAIGALLTFLGAGNWYLQLL